MNKIDAVFDLVFCVLAKIRCLVSECRSILSVFFQGDRFFTRAQPVTRVHRPYPFPGFALTFEKPATYIIRAHSWGAKRVKLFVFDLLLFDVFSFIIMIVSRQRF